MLKMLLVVLAVLVVWVVGCKHKVEIEPRLTISVCEADVVRVQHHERRSLKGLVVLDGYGAKDVKYNVTRNAGNGSVEIVTEKMRVVVKNGQLVQFWDLAGKKLTEEASYSIQQDSVQMQWETEPTEAIYGGGQYVNGELNYRSAPIKMIQFNTEAVIPFFVSSKGYGILWDHYSETMLNPPQKKLDLNSMLNKTTNFIPPHDGDYWLYVDVCKKGFGCDGGGKINLSIVGKEDGKVKFMCRHHLNNIPNSIACRLENMTQGTKYELTLSTAFPDVEVYYTSDKVSPNMVLRSKNENGANSFIDYYFVAGGSVDNAIAGYRRMTGSSKLQGKWVYGFWQCREHYSTQEEVLSIAEKYRNLGIPVDNIVQDWHYWGDLGWGPQWDAKYYPDPRGMVKQLNDLHFHFMVSVWSKFDEKTTFYQEMHSKGLILDNSIYMDPWHPMARKLFYRYSKTAHFDIGVDALWLDATEPEGSDQIGRDIYLGKGDSYLNTYSLMVAKSIHDGLRKDFPSMRIFGLTRSSFAGQQRYGATLWSGDTSGSWDSLRRQIAMSINYQLSGMPTWSMDIGGFFRPHDQYTSEDYHKLLIRWFQFGVFVPVFRVHGAGSHTEVWNYGQQVQEILVNSTIHFRYRLLDYIYSGFRHVETHHYTMQRGLIFDFAHDVENVANIADQFMFGPNLLVAPIHTPDSSRSVYLPRLKDDGQWTDFFTGESLLPGTIVQVANKSLMEIPLYVKQGALLVLGCKRQYVDDPECDGKLELRIYGNNQDGSFYLYEDDGVTQDGNSTMIAFHWNHKEKQLTIGKRSGQTFPGMLSQRTVEVVFVRENHGIGIERTEAPDLAVPYNGEEVKVNFAKHLQHISLFSDA